MNDKYAQLKKNIKTISEPFEGLMRLTMDSAGMAIQDLEETNFMQSIANEYWQKDAKRLDQLNIIKQGLIESLHQKVIVRDKLIVAQSEHIETINSTFERKNNQIEFQKERIEKQSALICHQAKQIEFLQKENLTLKSSSFVFMASILHQEQQKEIANLQRENSHLKTIFLKMSPDKDRVFTLDELVVISHIEEGEK